MKTDLLIQGILFVLVLALVGLQFLEACLLLRQLFVVGGFFFHQTLHRGRGDSELAWWWHVLFVSVICVVLFRLVLQLSK